MGNLQRRTFEAIDRLKGCDSADQVLGELSNLAANFGFERFCISGVPAPHERLDPYILLNGWPEGWIERYLARDYFRVDPIMRAIRTTTMPIVWSSTFRAGDDPETTSFMDEARSDFGLADGVAIPIYCVDGGQAIVSFGGHSFDSTDATVLALHLIATFAHGQIDSIMADRRTKSLIVHHLTKREIECLQWASEGKTTWETSVIMSLSERTVREYLERAARKLAAVNRVQTIANAWRAGLLF